MVLKSNKDFEIFKSEFRKWQTRFGLNGYQIYFRHESIPDAFADICIKQLDRVATVRLDNRNLQGCDIKKSAKHEALHLLTHELESCAFNRHVSENEIVEASEELVVRLQGLIK